MIFATFRLALILFFRMIARFVFCFSKKRKPIAFSNINLCFNVKNKQDKIRNCKVIKKSFISLGHSFADFLLLPFYKKDRLNRCMSIKNLHYFEQAYKRGKGVILSGAHFGSWELAAHFLALNGFRSLILYNPIKWPQWLEVYVKKNRQISGNVLIPKKNSFISVYKRLRKGGVVVFATDQVCNPEDGRKVSLFNNNVWTHTGFIKLSLKTGAPIVPGFVFTKGLFKYEIEIGKPLDPDEFKNKKDPEKEMAICSNNALEQAICRAPHHWMWQHRRFKNL